MLYSLGTFPRQPDSYWQWIKRAFASLEWVSPHLLPSWASFLSSLKMSGKYKFSLLTCVYFLLVKSWAYSVPMAVWAHQTFLREGSRVKEQRLSGSPLSVQFVLHLLPYRGSHDLTFLLSYSSSLPALLTCCFTLLPVLCLKTTSDSGLAPVLWIHQKQNILWSSAMHLARWCGRTDGQQHIAGNDTWFMCFCLHNGP